MNPLYEQLQKNHQNGSPFGNLTNMLQQIQQIKRSGIDPNQKIQEMLNSGQVTQEQYNQAAAKAQQLRQILGK